MAEDSGCRVCSSCSQRLSREHFSSKQWQAKAKSRKCLKCTTSPNGEKILLKRGQVEVLDTKAYGRILRTTSAVSKGDLIWKEEPIVHSAERGELTQREEIFAAVLGSRFGLSVIEDFLFLKAYVALSLPDRRRVLDCYYPSKAEVSESPLLSALIQICDPIVEELRRGKQGVLRDWDGSPVDDAEELKKVVLVKATNAHAFYVEADVTACALYELGSKMRHSCAPNVVYSSQRGASSDGSFVALTDLPPNAELRFSYIETVAPACMRRQLLLNNYVFYCDCPLCASVDYYRGLPCPKCSPRKGDWVQDAEIRLIDVADLEMPQALDQGTIYRVERDDYQWLCSSCGAQVTQDECGVPEDLEDSLMDIARNADDLDEFELSQHLRSMPRILGVNHAAVWMIRKAHIAKLLESDGALELIKGETADVLAAVDHAGELCRKALGPGYYVETGAGFMESLLTKVAAALARGRQWSLAEEYFERTKRSMLSLMEVTDAPVVAVDEALVACRLRDVSRLPKAFRG
ncbi:hypothetical protein FOZ60_009902 [Perkinsus olseni]|uniref:SET domain-containing protein n=1 Tax=Perkinsus olseni TaxID=32597 RepID=A0A7J6PNV7_PEROL|nr:hypothetical protein FOZ60_009902 [Perkinsus olseni]